MDFDKEYELRKLDILEKRLELHEKSTKRKSIIRFLLGTLLGTMVAASIWSLFNRPIPIGNKDVLIALVSGMTGSFFGAVVSYYFGDSDNMPEQLPVEPPDTPSKEKYGAVGKDY